MKTRHADMSLGSDYQSRGQCLAPFVELYRKKVTILRLDVVPFAICHTIAHAHAWSALSRASQNELIFSMIGIPTLLILQLLTFLGTRWSVSWKCFVAYDRCLSWETAEWALVIPRHNGGRSGLVPLHHDLSKGSDAWFTFQKQTFVRDAAAMVGWSILTSPFEGMPLHKYFENCRRGIETSNELASARAKWGANEFQIPDPSFLELFEEYLNRVSKRSERSLYERNLRAGIILHLFLSSKLPAACCGPWTSTGYIAHSLCSCY